MQIVISAIIIIQSANIWVAENISIFLTKHNKENNIKQQSAIKLVSILRWKDDNNIECKFSLIKYT